MSNGMPNMEICSLTVVPQQPTTLYVGGCGINDQGVYQSTDGAQSWHTINSGLNKNSARVRLWRRTRRHRSRRSIPRATSICRLCAVSNPG